MNRRKFGLVFVFILLTTLAAYAQGTWTTKAPMPTHRSGLTAAGLNGKLYAVP